MSVRRVPDERYAGSERPCGKGIARIVGIEAGVGSAVNEGFDGGVPVLSNSQ